jgi:Lon protease-like protein
MIQESIAIFPLPNVVFFPRTVLPLYIFEPRYCEMVKDTVSSKQLIGMFLLKPGWQEDYYGNPPVFPIGCAGEMIHVESLPEGKFNIILRGLYRVRPIELIQELPYRTARVEILPEIVSQAAEANTLLRELTHLYKRFISLAQAEQQQAPEISTDLNELVNTLATVLPLEIETRFQLLSMNDILERARSLLEFLNKQVSLLAWTNRFSQLRPTDPNLN